MNTIHDINETKRKNRATDITVWDERWQNKRYLESGNLIFVEIINVRAPVMRELIIPEWSAVSPLTPMQWTWMIGASSLTNVFLHFSNVSIAAISVSLDLTFILQEGWYKITSHETPYVFPLCTFVLILNKWFLQSRNWFGISLPPTATWKEKR